MTECNFQHPFRFCTLNTFDNYHTKKKPRDKTRENLLLDACHVTCMEAYVGGQLNNINLIFFFTLSPSPLIFIHSCCERANTIEFLTHCMYDMSKIMLIRDKKPNLRDMRQRYVNVNHSKIFCCCCCCCSDNKQTNKKKQNTNYIQLMIK